MNSLQKFSRPERITAGAGIVLLIGMFAFPWYHFSFDGFGSYNGNALQGPGSFFSVVALIVLIALLGEFAVRRFASAQLPTIPVSWNTAELYGAIAVLALLVIKILFHIGNFGWGFYADIVLAAVMVYGAFGISRQADTAPVHTAAHGGN